MIVAITGASGHVGANLVRELLRMGRTVRAVVHSDPRALHGLDIETVHADVTDETSLTAALSGAEVVYHLAAQIRLNPRDPRQVLTVNAQGTRNVIDGCLRCGVRRLVHFSSIQALTAISPDQPVDESSPLATSETVSVYDRSKALAEEAVLAGAARGLDAVIVTPTGVVGPYDFKTSLMGRAIKLLAEGGLRFLVAGGFDWVDVRDVAAGAIAAEECGRAGERYILSGHWCSIPGLAQLVDEITGRRRHRFVVPSGLARLGVGGMSRLARLAGRVPLYTPEAVEILRRYRHVSCRKAADELGYRARPLRSTLQDTVAWWREVTP